MKGYSIILVVFLLILGTRSGAQKTVADYLQLSQLENKEAISLDTLNTEQLEFAPSFFRDGLLFVNGNSSKKRIDDNEKIAFQLMFAKGDLIDGFTEAVIFDSITTKGVFDGPVCYDPENQWLIATKNQSVLFETEEGNEMKLGLYFFQFADSAWTYLSAFPYNNRQYNVCHPAWDPARKQLYFASDMPGGFGGLDLYFVDQNEDGSWSGPKNLGISINTSGNDCFPFIYKTDILFFSSDGKVSNRGFDIYASVRNEGIWLESIALPAPLNSRYDDLGLQLDALAQQLYFASARPGGKGKDDLFAVHLDQPLVEYYPDYHTVQVMNSSSGLPVKGASVVFYNFETKDALVEKDKDRFSNILFTIDPNSVVGSTPEYTNGNGEVNLGLNIGDYILQVEKEHYRTKQHLVTIEKMGKSMVVEIDSVTCKKATLLVVDANTSGRLDSVRAFLGDGKEMSAASQGKIAVCVSRENPMDITIKKESYQDFGLRLEFEALTDGEEIAIALRPDKQFTEELPVFSGEFTILEDILYGFDSADLDSRAKKELDRLAEHMIQYPSIRIELSAHTDSRGGEVYNQLLSERRASVARSYLVEKGIEEWRIAATGYGESRLLNHCSDGVSCPESEHAKNRRTEVRVLAGEQ